MDKVNLDINTYTLTELENLFKLVKPYSEEDILNKKKILENEIYKSNINQIKKEELYIFLDNINNKLTNEYFNSLRPDDKIFNDVNKYDGNHYVIKNKNNQYESVLENNKKINKSIIKKTYTIDSIFRANYNDFKNQSHDYIIELPETITNAITFSISSIEIPLCYHNISDSLNNNTFRIELNRKQSHTNSEGEIVTNFSSDFSCNIELIPGLYESLFASNAQRKAQNIENHINDQISNQVNEKYDNNLSADSAYNKAVVDICNNLQFKINLFSGYSMFLFNNNDSSPEVKIDDDTQIVINYNINNSNSIENCKENELYQKLGWQLGFRVEKSIIDKSALIDGDIGVAMSACICHISYPRYLYIAIDDYQTSSRNHFSVAAPSTIAPNIIARINILSCLEDKTAFKNCASPGDYLYTNKHIKEYFGPTNIKKLRIQLLDEYGRPFPINNMDWSFVASFECFYN